MAQKDWVRLADVIITAAKELNITTLRKPIWDLKVEITKQVEDGKIEGKIGREVLLDPIGLERFVKNKKKSLNIPEVESKPTEEDIKKLILNLKNIGLNAEEILAVICTKLKISSL